MKNMANHVRTRVKATASTPQTERTPGVAEVRNNAGGFVFDVGRWAQLDRFLILGSEGGSFYATERKLTVENAASALACIAEDGPRVVARVVEISESGRAPKNDPAIFVLALAAAHGNQATRQAAFAAVSRVCRIGTHLFHFAEAVQARRGWGRGLRDAVGRWYLNRDEQKLATQLLKYQQRDGWSHRDLLRLAHPKPESSAQSALFKHVVSEGKAEFVSDNQALNEYMTAYQTVKTKSYGSLGEAVSLIATYGLQREMLPTELLNEPLVWEALLSSMGTTALVRNLGKLTALGLARSGESRTRILSLLSDQQAISNSRIHPLQVLTALRQYAVGHGDKGSLTWAPEPAVLDALDKAFYLAFANAPRTNQRMLLALDVSGSMSSPVSGVASLSCREAAAALALVTLHAEPDTKIIGFTSAGFGGKPSLHYGYAAGVSPLAISSRQRLDDVVRYTAGLAFGGTDCALPMLYAIQQKLEIDTFVIYTDNETWAGGVKPVQALAQYRAASGINAKLAVVALTASPFTIADPNDPNTLDIVGFDAALPAILAEFQRGFGRAPEEK